MTSHASSVNLEQIIPETIVLKGEVLERLHMTLETCKRLAFRGEFPPIKCISRGVYAVRPADLTNYCEGGDWITKTHHLAVGIDVKGNLRRAAERKVAAQKGRRQPPRSASGGVRLA